MFSHSLVGKQSRATGPEISATGYERTVVELTHYRRIGHNTFMRFETVADAIEFD